MAQNQVSIIAPRSAPQEQKKDKPDDWERVLQGLQIANGALGIGVNFTTIQKHMAEKQNLDDERAGIISQKQVLESQKSGLEQVPAGTEGASVYKVNRGDEAPPVKMSLRAPAKAPKEAGTRAVTKRNADGSETTEIVADVVGGKYTGSAPKKDTTARDIARDDRTARDINGRFDELTKNLSSVRSTIGQEKTKLRVATHALNLIEGADLNKLTPIQVKEIAGAMAAQVSQGSPAQRTLEEMTPQTAANDLAKVYQYISGEPAPANQGEFAGMFKGMIERQMQTSRDIIQGEVGPLIANSSDLADHDPKRWGKILKAAGITADHDGVVTAYEPSYARSTQHDNTPRGESGTAIAAPSGGKPALPSAEVHPQAEAAKAKALKLQNSENPEERAAAVEVLRRLGVPATAKPEAGVQNAVGNKYRNQRG